MQGQGTGETPATIALRRLTAADVALMRQLLAAFGEAFEDPETYTAAPPRDTYLEGLLAGSSFIALAALEGDRVVGGVAAYELTKYEQERKEVYLYDLAVLGSHRRRGLATALILELKEVAARQGAALVYVQADREDEPAVALYRRLGKSAEVLHFEFAVDRNPAVGPP